MKIATCCSLLAVLLAFQHRSFAAGDALRGATHYQSRCAACHSLDFNGPGPAHRGVFGRKAGMAPNFSYSSALKAATLVWNEQTLDQWLTDPEKLVPGQKMGYTVADAEERADLIAYLKQQAEAPRK